MSAPRLNAELWVQAHLRLCAVNTIPAMVVRRGDSMAGSVLLKVNMLDGNAVLYMPSTGPDGGRLWLRLTGDVSEAEPEVDQRIAKAVARDPDLWVIEMEDRAGRHLLTDPVMS